LVFLLLDELANDLEETFFAGCPRLRLSMFGKNRFDVIEINVWRRIGEGILLAKSGGRWGVWKSCCSRVCAGGGNAGSFRGAGGSVGGDASGSVGERAQGC